MEVILPGSGFSTANLNRSFLRCRRGSGRRELSAGNNGRSQFSPAKEHFGTRYEIRSVYGQGEFAHGKQRRTHRLGYWNRILQSHGGAGEKGFVGDADRLHLHRIRCGDARGRMIHALGVDGAECRVPAAMPFTDQVTA